MYLCSSGMLESLRSEFACPNCRLPLYGRITKAELSQPVNRCWVCGNEEFFLQKDFNRELGIVILLGSVMVSLLSMLLIGHLFGIFCLLIVFLVDWAIYHLLATVTVCYLCQSVYRGFPRNPGHEGFYLGSEEKYKKRRQDWLKKVLGETKSPWAP
jgi:hypothetical protein